jgi:hypothetical protein
MNDMISKQQLAAICAASPPLYAALWPLKGKTDGQSDRDETEGPLQLFN